MSLMALGIAVLSNAQTVQTDRSTVNFEVSNMGFRTVNGTITGMKGTVDINTTDLSRSKIDITIDVNTIDTENKKRDDHLKNEDFFNVPVYPKIKFISTDITKDGAGYIAKGQLTIKDVTKTVEVPFTTKSSGGETIIEASLEIERKDYNVGEDYGSFSVGKTIATSITCVVK